MKISEMIKNLQEFMEKHGDLDCWYAVDDEGNEFHEVYFDPSFRYVDKYGDVYCQEDLDEEDEEDEKDFKPICIVN